MLAGQVDGWLITADSMTLGQPLNRPSDQAGPYPDRHRGFSRTWVIRIELSLGKIGVIALFDRNVPQTIHDLADFRIPRTGGITQANRCTVGYSEPVAWPSFPT